MNENEINELFDYTPEADTDPADGDPADGDTADGESATEGEGGEADTDPADGDTADGDPDDGDPAEGKEAANDANSRYAAARRKAEAERDKAIAEERAKFEREKNELIASMGLVNPYTGKAVTTADELKEYQSASAEAHKKAFMEKNGLDDASYNKFVGQLPEVVAANAAKAKAESAAREASRTEADQRLAAEFDIIFKLDPDMKTKEDVFRSENYGAVLDNVKKGLSLSDAYKLANYDKLNARAAAAERQRTLNAQNSKGHMTTVGNAHGQTLAPVPDAERDLYRYLNPDMSDEDIARDYNKRFKR